MRKLLVGASLIFASLVLSGCGVFYPNWGATALPEEPVITFEANQEAETSAEPEASLEPAASETPGGNRNFRASHKPTGRRRSYPDCRSLFGYWDAGSRSAGAGYYGVRWHLHNEIYRIGH